MKILPLKNKDLKDFDIILREKQSQAKSVVAVIYNNTSQVLKSNSLILQTLEVLNEEITLSSEQ